MSNNTPKYSCLAVCIARCTAITARRLLATAFLLLTTLVTVPTTANAASPGSTYYTNYVIDDVPWSIHVAAVDRQDPSIEIRSVHANGLAIGMSTLTAQIESVTNLGLPIAGLNGDFYQRDRSFAGDPRGLQIIDHELISGPAGHCFWISDSGELHIEDVESRFAVVFPDGTTKSLGLNGRLEPNEIQLYTPALGQTTHVERGRELILEQQDGTPWLPLQLGKIYQGRVREVREVGNRTLTSNIMVIAIGSSLAKELPKVEAGAVMKISTASSPVISGAKAAIGSGPALVRNHKKIKVKAPSSGSYEFSSMSERHPRSAVGWNEKTFFLVEVDGRQKQLSVGMTLDELGTFMAKLGCDEAVSLDGGGSSALWYNGKIRNSPCDGGKERPIANSLVILQRKTSAAPPPSLAR